MVGAKLVREVIYGPWTKHASIPDPASGMCVDEKIPSNQSVATLVPDLITNDAFRDACMQRLYRID